MHSEFSGDNSDLSWFDNVFIVCSEDDFEGSASIGAVSGSQNPIGSDNGGTAEPGVVNNKSHLPIDQFTLENSSHHNKIGF